MTPEEQKELYENLDTLLNLLTDDLPIVLFKAVKDITYKGQTAVDLTELQLMIPLEYQELGYKIFSTLVYEHDNIHVISTARRWLKQRV